MQVEIALKLLELTRRHNQLSLAQLSHELRSHADLTEELEEFREKRLLSLDQGKLELSSEQRIMIADQLIHGGSDPVKVSRHLLWKEFEHFAECAFTQNGFHVTRHFIFKSRIGRREIDLLAWNDLFLLAVDCKHWLRHLSPSRISDAAKAQVERAKALAERPELLTKVGVAHPHGRRIMPILLSLGEPRRTVADGVPVVQVSKLMSFLYGISPADDRFQNVRIKKDGAQMHLPT